MPYFSSFALMSLMIASIVSLLAARFLSRRTVALTFVAAFLVLVVGLPALYEWRYFTKPNRRDRATQRQAVQTRVAQAGGWLALEQECRAFLQAAPLYQESDSMA